MNKKNPMVTVIVPIYNMVNYLRACVDSILAQTYTNLEIILVDDGSSDGSGGICDEYACKDARIKVLHNSNGGLSHARNSGMAVSSGEFISFIDSDDYYFPHAIETMLGGFLDEDVAVSCSWYSRGELQDSASVISPFELKEGQALLKMCYEANPYVGDKMYRVSHLGSLKFAEGVVNEDTLFHYWLSKKIVQEGLRISVSNNICYHYTLRPDSLVTSRRSLIEVAMVRNLDVMMADARENYPDVYTILERGYIDVLMRLLDYVVDSKFHKEVWKEYRGRLCTLRYGQVRSVGNFNNSVIYLFLRYAPFLRVIQKRLAELRKRYA